MIFKRKQEPMPMDYVEIEQCRIKSLKANIRNTILSFFWIFIYTYIFIETDELYFDYWENAFNYFTGLFPEPIEVLMIIVIPILLISWPIFLFFYYLLNFKKIKELAIARKEYLRREMNEAERIFREENEARFREEQSQFYRNFNKFAKESGGDFKDFDDFIRNQKSHTSGATLAGDRASDYDIAKATLMIQTDDFTMSDLKKARNDYVKRFSSDNTGNSLDDEKMKMINKAFDLLKNYAKK